MTAVLTTADPRADLAPHLAAYAAIHDAMVRDARRLQRLVAVMDEAVAPGLARWWERYETEIEHHHVREDDLVFPLVADRSPGFSADALVADHVVLDRHLAGLRRDFDDLGRGVTDLATVRDGLVDRVGALAEDLRAHLDAEEAAVFPVLASRVPADEYADLERGMRKGMSLRSLAFALPWILDDLAPDLRAHAEVPMGLRFLDALVWERSYRNLTRPFRAG